MLNLLPPKVNLRLRERALLRRESYLTRFILLAYPLPDHGLLHPLLKFLFFQTLEDFFFLQLLTLFVEIDFIFSFLAHLLLSLGNFSPLQYVFLKLDVVVRLLFLCLSVKNLKTLILVCLKIQQIIALILLLNLSRSSHLGLECV